MMDSRRASEGDLGRRDLQARAGLFQGAGLRDRGALASGNGSHQRSRPPSRHRDGPGVVRAREHRNDSNLRPSQDQAGGRSDVQGRILKDRWRTQSRRSNPRIDRHIADARPARNSNGPTADRSCRSQRRQAPHELPFNCTRCLLPWAMAGLGMFSPSCSSRLLTSPNIAVPRKRLAECNSH